MPCGSSGMMGTAQGFTRSITCERSVRVRSAGKTPKRKLQQPEIDFYLGLNGNRMAALRRRAETPFGNGFDRFFI